MKEVIGLDPTATGLKPEHELILLSLTKSPLPARAIAICLRGNGYSDRFGQKLSQSLSGLRTLGVIERVKQTNLGFVWGLTGKGREWVQWIKNPWPTRCPYCDLKVDLDTWTGAICPRCGWK